MSYIRKVQITRNAGEMDPRMTRSEDELTDYRTQHNDFWRNVERPGKPNTSLDEVATLISTTCGPRSVLDIGAGNGDLVAALLKRGIDASGIDISDVVVSRNNDRLPGYFSQGTVLALPFADESFETLVSVHCIECLTPNDVPAALQELYRVTRRSLFLKIASVPPDGEHLQLISEGRAWWEARCFEAGFRKHPHFYTVNPYESLNGDHTTFIIPLEKIPNLAHATYPLAALREERDLHMDMLREHGSRSDAHVDRYNFACRYIRPGDIVIDAACGLGYGSYIVHNLTKCTKVTGIDGSAYGVNYATSNFGAADKIIFTEGYLPNCLGNIPDDSVDTAISFETLEHVEDPVALLNEFHRILTPGGRLIVSVPHDWSDESGFDPNPFHLHVYDRKKLLSELGGKFEIEKLFGQTADRIKKPGSGCEWVARPRSLQELDPNSADIPVEAEWLLAVACKSPIGGENVPYIERAFSESEQAASGNALAFARDYENPWLLRSMVSIGLRTEKDTLREKWSKETLERATSRSADRGAALCALAYIALDSGIDLPRKDLIDAIDEYISYPVHVNPNAFRWQVSLAYVRALIELATGKRASAKRYLELVLEASVIQYSPTLLTKSANAAYLLGMIHAASGEFELADSVWRKNFREVLTAIGQHLKSPYATLPPGFEVREIASVISLAGRLAVAASNLDELSVKPAVFREQVESDLAGYVADLLKGKQWLENEWKSAQTQFLEQTAYLKQVIDGKNWLEAQWRSGQSEMLAKDEQLLELTKSYDKTTASFQELSEAYKELNAQMNREVARTQKILNYFPVRLLKKLRLLRFDRIL